MQHLRLMERVSVTRSALHGLLATQGVPEDLTGEDLVVRCRLVWLGDDDFTDELVRQAICVRHARSVILVGVSQQFLGKVRASAARRGVSDQVTTGVWAELVA